MKEDIEKLENDINYNKRQMKEKGSYIPFDIKLMERVENLLKAYKEDEAVIEEQQKEIEKLKEYKKQSIPLYKIIDKLDDLELSEELQEKWDNFMSGSEAVTKAYKELIIESKGEKE